VNGFSDNSSGNVEFDFALHGGVPLITLVL